MRDFNVFVCSLPRCGSSMMVGIVERLGVRMVYTSEDATAKTQRDARYKSRFGEYVPNPFFGEITENQYEQWVSITHNLDGELYRGCKVIIPVAGMRWSAMLCKPAKIIVMKRDFEEIYESQQAFYGKNPEITYLDKNNEIANTRDTAIAKLASTWASARHQFEVRARATHSLLFGDSDMQPFDLKVVDYSKVLQNPRETIQEIADYIQAPNPIDAAVGSVTESSRRFVKSEIDKTNKQSEVQQ